MSLLINPGVRPKRRKNIVKWMEKCQVGVLHTSLNYGTTRAIEQLSKNDLWT